MFARRRGASVLTAMTQRAPGRVLFPAVEDDEPTQAVLLNTAGGLAGGDRMALSVTAGPAAGATITSQAAEKVYRSLGADAVVEAALTLHAGARLDWLPQETILFDGARLRRRLAVAVAPDARFLGAEIVLFGRAARGERLTYGLLHDKWAVRVDGRLAWVDAVRLDGDIAAGRMRPFGFGQAAGYASVILAGDGAASFLPVARDALAAAQADGGATLVNGVLVVRLLDIDAARLREAAGAVAMALRQAAGIGPARLPRVWRT